jgi:hypothetical protein
MLQVQELVKLCPMKRQTMLFSATMTHDVDKLAAYSLKRPVRITADSSIRVDEVGANRNHVPCSWLKDCIRDKNDLSKTYGRILIDILAEVFLLLQVWARSGYCLVIAACQDYMAEGLSVLDMLQADGTLNKVAVPSTLNQEFIRIRKVSLFSLHFPQ